MKKTVTANIAGSVFHVEEDAYEQLQRYLAGIRANFSGSAGAEEIMSDIEARIAELFTERLTGRDVVTLADVQHVESVMGRPEDFGGADSTTEPPPFNSAGGKSTKRFMRDPDDKWVGGVIGGLAAYVNTDAIWFRVAFILAVYLGWGTPVFVYILLWILVPKASTAAERLQMRGEPVTVDNIKRVVEESGERFKQGAERMADEAKDLGKDWGPRAQQFSREASATARNAGSGLGSVIRKLIGVAFIIVAFGFLMGLVSSAITGSFGLLGSNWEHDGMGVLDAGSLLFSGRGETLAVCISGFILLAVPVIVLFLIGFRLLLRTRSPKWLGWSLVALWCASLIYLVNVGVRVGGDFRRENASRIEVPISQPASGTMYMDQLVPETNDSLGGWSVSYDDGEVSVDMDGLHVADGSVYGGWGQADVEQSPDSLFHLIVQREAHGRTAKAALQRAENIGYRFKQQDDAVLLSRMVQFPVADKIRAQDIRFVLQVPVGKSVFFRPGAEDVIYDVDNTTNTHDDDMIGKSWLMTARGLELPGGRALPTDSLQGDTIIIRHVFRAPKHPMQETTRTEEPPEGTQEEEKQEASLELPNLFSLFSRNVHI